MRRSNQPESDEQYSFSQLLGTGAYGEVWRATDTILDRDVAVKLLNFTGDGAGLEALEQNLVGEARIQARLANERKSHPNIVTVIGLRRFGRRIGIVMEYVDGPSLADWCQRDPRPSHEAMAAIAIQVCDGLEHAHRQSVIHRDIKPRNIIVGRADNVAKIADWGVAKVLQQTGFAGTYTGTPPYMSPEMVLLESDATAGPGGVDHRTDIYSLGVTMFQMFTGQLPFRNPVTRHREILAGVGAEHEALLSAATGSPLLTEIVMRAVACEPSRRYASVVEMRDALAAWVAVRDMWARHGSGEAAEAELLSARAQRLAAGHAGVYLECARFEMMCQREESARNVLSRGLEVAPNCALLWNARGRLQARAVSPLAAADLERALQLGLPQAEERRSRATLQRLSRTARVRSRELNSIEESGWKKES